MRKPSQLRCEAHLQFNRARNAAVVRVGPRGFNPDDHEAWYAGGTLFFELHKRSHGPGLVETVSVVEVYGFSVVKEKKIQLMPGSDGLMDFDDWRALGFALAPHAMVAWFEKERVVSDEATGDYHDLAKYKEALRG